MSLFDPQTILKDFEKLQLQYKQQETQVATKADLAISQRDKALVDQATSYTADTIFQALAKLQATFGESTSQLTRDMTAEVERLSQIQRAIQVEKARLDTLHNIQIAAEALNILQQEHQQACLRLDLLFEEKTTTLDAEMTQQRALWQQIRQDYEAERVKQQSTLEKTRHAEEEDYQYTVQRKQTLDADEYEKQKRTLERQLIEEAQLKEKDWAEREQYLTTHKATFEENKAKVEKAPKVLEEAVKKAREEAIRETHKDEENKAKLLEKELEAKRKAYELKIASFKQVIEDQKAQITDLSQKLQSASEQVQKLAMQAVTSTATTKSTDKTSKSG